MLISFRYTVEIWGGVATTSVIIDLEAKMDSIFLIVFRPTIFSLRQQFQALVCPALIEESLNPQDGYSLLNGSFSRQKYQSNVLFFPFWNDLLVLINGLLRSDPRLWINEGDAISNF